MLVKVGTLDLQLHLGLLLELLMLFHFGLHIDLSPFLSNSILVVIDINVHNVILMKLFSPSVRNTVFHLVFKHYFVWRFCQSLIDACFMQFIKLVIKLSDHLLDVLGLFLLIKFVDNSLLDFSLTDRDSRSLVLLESNSYRLLPQNLLNRSVLVLLQEVDIAIIHIVDDLLIHLEMVLNHPERLFAVSIDNVYVIDLFRAILQLSRAHIELFV